MVIINLQVGVKVVRWSAYIIATYAVDAHQSFTYGWIPIVERNIAG